MECCSVANYFPDPDHLHTKLLVTDDYKFFKGFIRSSYAQEVLMELVTDVLHLKTGVKVLLAGEVIEGV